MSSARLAELFHVLKAIRQIVDEMQEAFEPAIADAARDRAHVDGLQRAIVGERAMHGMDLERFVHTLVHCIAQLHATCQLLIGERETLGQALASIRRELELVNIVPRTENLGESSRGKEKPVSPAPSIPKRRPIKAGLKPRRKGSAS